MPEGLPFFEFKPGTRRIAIVPYLVKKGKETRGGNPFAPAGVLHYERTYFAYRAVGPDEKMYTAPSKTFGEPDYIKEHREQLARNPDTDKDTINALNAKERQLFLVWDLEDKEKGLQLMELSYHNFGKKLDSRIKNSTDEEGWDQFYFPDEGGFNLKLTIEEVTGRFKYKDCTAIDFIARREPLPDHIVNHGFDLDEMPRRVGYEELKRAFLGLDAPRDEGDGSGDGRREQQTQDRPAARSEPQQTRQHQEPQQTHSPERKKPAEDPPVQKRMDDPPAQKRQDPPATSDVGSSPTAEELGLKVDDIVLYNGSDWKIAAIVNGGTSLKMMTDDGGFVRDVSPSAVKKLKVQKPEAAKPETLKKKPPRDEPPFEKADAPQEDAGSIEDDWDAGWQK